MIRDRAIRRSRGRNPTAFRASEGTRESKAFDDVAEAKAVLVSAPDYCPKRCRDYFRATLLVCTLGISTQTMGIEATFSPPSLSTTLSPTVIVPPVAAPTSTSTSQPGVASTPPSSNPAPEMGIGVPAHGAALYDTSSWYDATTGLITVRGSIANVPKPLINSGNYQITIDGQYLASVVSASAAQRQIVFEGLTPALVIPTWVKRTVLAELVDTGSSEVVARDMVNYFDLRVADQASPDEQYGPIFGMAVQLTDAGLGESIIDDRPTSLEVPLLASLPYPSVDDFNDSLASAAQALPPDAGPSEVDACINLADAIALEPRLTTTAEYVTIYGLAYGYYLAYEAFQEAQTCTQVAATLGAANPFVGLIGALGCEVAMSTYCVKDPPQVEDFELCVGELQADPTTLDIYGVSDVTLAFVNSDQHDGARIASGYSVDSVSGSLDGLVRGLSFRWSGTSCSAPPPETRISDSRLSGGDWLQDFTTCEDITVDAPSAATSDVTQAEFEINAAVNNDEALRVSLVTAGEMELIDPSVNVENGICAESFLIDEAEALALSYQDEFEDTLNDIWNGVGTSNHQSQALEVLLSRFDLGLPAHDHYGFDATFIEPLSSNPLEGTQFTWRTQVLELDNGVETAPLNDTVFLHPAHPAPYFENARNDQYERFDLSFNITTGYLNQLLHVRSKKSLNLTYEPTWDELATVGVNAPAGGPGDAPATLDGDTLGQIDPSFSVLGTTEVAIEIKASLDPVAWMHPDPPSFMEDPVSGFPVGYGIAGVEIRFIETVTGGSTTSTTGREWLRLKLSFLDPDVGLIMGLNEPNLISLNMLNDDWGLAVESSLFNGCPMVPHGNWEPAASCERTLEQTLAPLFRNLLRPRFVAMLSDIQSPQVFEASWGSAVSFDVGRVWKSNQNITYYGDIPDF